MPSRYEFGHCCGINIFAAFPYVKESTNPDLLNARSSQDLDAAVKYVNSNVKYNKCGINMIVLTQDQTEMKKRLIDECGYTCVIDGAFHPKHDSQLYLLVKAPFSEERGEQVIPSGDTTNEKIKALEAKVNWLRRVIKDSGFKILKSKLVAVTKVEKLW